MQKALLIIDWEQEWVNPDSEYYIGSDLHAETENINKLTEYARSNSLKVIFIKHIEPEGEAFQEGQSGTEFIKNLIVEDADVVIKKQRISAFYKTSLEDELADIDHVVVAGILTNLCVRSVVQDAYDRDFSITIVSDCCLSFDQETQDFTLKDLKATRPEVSMIELDEFLQKNNVLLSSLIL